MLAASGEKLDLVVCPELFLSGYNVGDRVLTRAEPKGGPSQERASAIARKHRTALVYGYPESDDGITYNAAVCLDADGRSIAHYRKRRLPNQFERANFSCGSGYTQFALNGWKVAMLICYDVEFPEAMRACALGGAQLVVAPTALKKEWTFVARTVIPTRAFENGLFLAYANYCGSEGEFEYLGESCFAGPGGKVVAAGDTENSPDVDAAFCRSRSCAACSPLSRRLPESFLAGSVTEVALDRNEAAELKARLRASLRVRKAKALVLVAPLLVFVTFTFLVPIILLLERSFTLPEMQALLPTTAQALAAWDGQQLPPEPAWAALVTDLAEAGKNATASKVGAILNQETSGARSLIIATAREASELASPYQDSLVALDERWADPKLWGTLKRLTSGWTLSYYANALDLRIVGYDDVEQQPEGRRLYLSLFLRTLKIAGIVTAACLILAYPVANLLASVSPRTANILLMLVLLPFWTSLLVRTTAWIVLLQKQGVINDLLVHLGFISDENRLALIYNQTGTVIAMTHVLLPFMILPIYAVMKSVPPSYMRAAMSLGAPPFVAFMRVYLPQTMPGVGAGVILVFILAIGYYITPALVGGDSGTLISNLIAYHIQRSLNWGLAAALSVLLLVCVLALYFVYDRIVGIDKLKVA